MWLKERGDLQLFDAKKLEELSPSEREDYRKKHQAYREKEMEYEEVKTELKE